MMKTQIGLGVLSIPAAFDILGMVPGVICMMVTAALTTWGAYVIGPFKRKHPEIYGIDDAAGLVFGRVGRELLSIGFVLCELKYKRFVRSLSNVPFPLQFLSSVLVPACLVSRSA